MVSRILPAIMDDILPNLIACLWTGMCDAWMEGWFRLEKGADDDDDDDDN